MAQAPAVGSIIEMRVARLSSAADYRHLEFGYPDYLRAALKEEPYRTGVFVSEAALLSDEDFSEILDISPGAGGLSLIVKLSAAGVARMQSGVSLGEHIATLVNSQLVDVAPLVGYFRVDVPLFITLRMPGPIAESVAVRLRARNLR
jgi:hypothetical protein